MEQSTGDIAPTPVTFDADSGTLLDSLESGLEVPPQPQAEPGLPITTSMAASVPEQLVAPDEDGLGSDVDEQTRWGRSTTGVEATAPGEQVAMVPPVVAPEAEMPVVEPIAPPAVPNRDAPEVAEPEETLTRSGFRKRRRGKEGAPVATAKAEQPDDHAEPAPRRDAQSVQASLARFRAGVEEGRAVPGTDSTDQKQSEGGQD